MSVSKVCPKCGELKPFSEFYKDRRNKAGYQTYCKNCEKAYKKTNSKKVKDYQANYHVNYRKANPEKEKERQAKYREINRDKERERIAKYYAANSEKKKQYNAEYRANNPEKIKYGQHRYRVANTEKCRAKAAKWYQDNPDYNNKYRQANLKKRRYLNAKYRASKLLAVPSWLTQSDYKAIKAIYKEADRLTQETGIKHHVDHIHPLQGKLVCGFHCPSNLQILTESENLAKHNKFTPYVESA